MQLDTQQAYSLLSTHRVFARECCDKCGQILGAVRFTRKDDSGVWCSRECRGDAQQVIRKGGRPRKHLSNAEKQKAYRQALRNPQGQIASVTKPPCSFAEIKDLQAQKTPLSHYPSSEAISSTGAA